MNSLKIILFVSLPLALTLLSSCSETPTGPNQSSTNLIQNSDFEVRGFPSLSSWVYDTSLASVVNTGPDSDYAWSLQLKPAPSPQQSFAQTYVSGLSGAGTYEVSVWMKADSDCSATLSFGTWSQGSWVYRNSVSSQVGNWLLAGISDSLSPSASDSIAVRLSTAETQISSGTVLFSGVTLQKVR